MSAVRPGTGWSALHPSETSPTGAIEAAKSYRKERNTVPASPYFRSLLEKDLLVLTTRCAAAGFRYIVEPVAGGSIAWQP
jgi:hypothetical protein